MISYDAIDISWEIRMMELSDVPEWAMVRMYKDGHHPIAMRRRRVRSSRGKVGVIFIDGKMVKEEEPK